MIPSREPLHPASSSPDSHTALISVEDLSSSLVLVRLHGEHDFATMPQLRQALTARKSVVVDLSEASFIDSSIVGLLAASSSRLLLVVVSPPGTHPRRVLDTARAGDLMLLVDTQTAALHTFGEENPSKHCKARRSPAVYQTRAITGDP